MRIVTTTNPRAAVRYRIIFFLAILPAALPAQTTCVDAHSKTVLSFSLYESEFSPGKYVLPADSTGRFVRYTNGKLPLTRDEHDRMITLRASFIDADSLPTEPIFLILPPFEYPAGIYLNGKLILMRGNIAHGYTTRLHDTKAVLLPPGFMNGPNTPNVLAIELYSKEGETRKPFGDISIAGRRTAVQEEFIRNLFGPTFAFVLLVSSLLMAVYFLRLYASNIDEGKRYYLYIGLLNFSVAFSSINNALTNDFQTTLVLELIAKVAYIFTVLYTLLFIAEYTDVLKSGTKKKLFRFAVVIATAGASSLAAQPTLGRQLQWYTPQLIFLFYPVFAFVLYLLFRRVRAGTNKFAIWLLVIYVMNLGFMVHDTLFYIVRQTKPFINLAPYAIFFVNLMVFLILAWEQRVMQIRSKKGENELKHLYANLEALVEERTAQLNSTVEDLNQEIHARRILQEELDRANKTKDNISFVIGHDLRNIFNTMLNYSEGLIDDIRDGKLKNIEKDSRLINTAAISAHRFLENLLEWSAAQTKILAFNPERLSAAEIVSESIELVKLQSDEKSVGIEIGIPPSLFIRGDRGMIQSIIRNLVSNAVKYSYPDGVVTITTVEDGDRVTFVVKDTGMGIPDVGELYKNEIQQSRRGTSKERGIGIGLLMVKDMLARHNSALEISSTPGGGSTLRFSITRDKEAHT